jgi:hypothetical protein
VAGPSAKLFEEAFVAEDGRNQTLDDLPGGRSFGEIEEPRTESGSIDAKPATSAEAMVDSNEPGETDYKVGYKRPPKETRIKPGERRNPRGRPPGSRNLKTIVTESLTKTISVRRGDKIKRVPTMEAITDTFALKAAEGDVKAAGIVINLVTKAGILDGRNDATENEGSEGVVPARAGASPGDALFEGVDPKRLSKDEQFELSKIAERVDAGGDVIALNSDDFARLKQLVNKGRGKNVVPRVDEKVDEAA